MTYLATTYEAASRFDWDTFANYLFPPDGVTVRAAITTFSTAVVAQILGVLIGLLSALMQRSAQVIPKSVAAFYLWVIRGTPLIVQIFFVFYGTNLLLGINIIPRQVELFGFGLSGAVLAGTAALAINEGAYMSEIIRAGIGSVDVGQIEAAKVVGMTRSQAMRRVVLPQAARVIVPPLGNEFNNMLKSTSLLAFIGVNEVFNDGQVRYSATFQPVEYFAGVAVVYLLMTTIWSLVQSRIEKRLNVAYGPIVSPKSTSWRRRVMAGAMSARSL